MGAAGFHKLVGVILLTPSSCQKPEPNTSTIHFPLPTVWAPVPSTPFLFLRPLLLII